jgi:UDP-N-acetyl-2-amino-2-deoxyglucuronate dehydrogenase
MNKTNAIGFAIVGCGRIGERHAGHVGDYGQLAAVCDLIEAKAEKIANAHGARAFADVDDMLESCRKDVDVVAICTPNGLHAEHTIRAFQAGYHVICEKPMARTVQECGEMIKAGERANKRLFVVKQNRHNPPVEHLKALLDAGKLGRIYSAHLNCFWHRNDAYYADGWKGTLAMDGGTLYTQFSHFIDLLYWLIGDVRDVYAMTDNFMHKQSVEFEDTGVAILRFHSGCLGSVSFTINSWGKNMEGSLTLFCEKGTIKIGGQYLNEIEYENIEGMKPTQLRQGRTANDYGFYQGSMSNHQDVYANVERVLSEQGTIGTVGFEGLKTVEIIDKIYRAARRATAQD